MAPLTPHVVLKDHRHHLLTKYEGKGTKISFFKLFIKLGIIWKCNLGFSKKTISHLFYNLEKSLKYTHTAQDQHFNIQILNLWMNWEKLCPNLSFTIENKMGNLHKKWPSNIKLNINDCDIPFPIILRIYQWIGKNIFDWGKWNDAIGSYARTTQCLAKMPRRDLFLAYIYKPIRLVNSGDWSINIFSYAHHYFSFSQDFVDTTLIFLRTF